MQSGDTQRMPVIQNQQRQAASHAARDMVAESIRNRQTQGYDDGSPIDMQLVNGGRHRSTLDQLRGYENQAIDGIRQDNAQLWARRQGRAIQAFDALYDTGVSADSCAYLLGLATTSLITAVFSSDNKPSPYVERGRRKPSKTFLRQMRDATDRGINGGRLSNDDLSMASAAILGVRHVAADETQTRYPSDTARRIARAISAGTADPEHVVTELDSRDILDCLERGWHEQQEGLCTYDDAKARLDKTLERDPTGDAMRMCVDVIQQRANNGEDMSYLVKSSDPAIVHLTSAEDTHRSMAAPDLKDDDTIGIRMRDGALVRDLVNGTHVPFEGVLKMRRQVDLDAVHRGLGVAMDAAAYGSIDMSDKTLDTIQALLDDMARPKGDQQILVNKPGEMTRLRLAGRGGRASDSLIPDALIVCAYEHPELVGDTDEAQAARARLFDGIDVEGTLDAVRGFNAGKMSRHAFDVELSKLVTSTAADHPSLSRDQLLATKEANGRTLADDINALGETARQDGITDEFITHRVDKEIAKQLDQASQVIARRRMPVADAPDDDVTTDPGMEYDG